MKVKATGGGTDKRMPLAGTRSAIQKAAGTEVVPSQIEARTEGGAEASQGTPAGAEGNPLIPPVRSGLPVVTQGAQRTWKATEAEAAAEEAEKEEKPESTGKNGEKKKPTKTDIKTQRQQKAKPNGKAKAKAKAKSAGRKKQGVQHVEADQEEKGKEEVQKEEKPKQSGGKVKKSRKVVTDDKAKQKDEEVVEQQVVADVADEDVKLTKEYVTIDDVPSTHEAKPTATAKVIMKAQKKEMEQKLKGEGDGQVHLEGRCGNYRDGGKGSGTSEAWSPEGQKGCCEGSCCEGFSQKENVRS